MNLEKSDNDKIFRNFGFYSLLFGVFFWIYFAFWFCDSFNFLAEPVWDALGRILDGNAGETWITVFVVMIIIPAISHLLGFLFGLLGVFSPNRKYAILGLLINSILPIWLLINKFTG